MKSAAVGLGMIVSFALGFWLCWVLKPTRKVTEIRGFKRGAGGRFEKAEVSEQSLPRRLN